MGISDRKRPGLDASEGPGPPQAGNGQGAVAVASDEVAPRSTVRLALSLVFWAPLLGISMLLAAYTGFRLPNLWSATLYTTSLPDGFHRRFVVGTLLHPLSEAPTTTTGSTRPSRSYPRRAPRRARGVTLRARLVSQRFLVVAFFLLPTGGFLFHEVGYLDQLLYLMLFTSLWLLRRRGAPWIAAPVIMSLAVFTHEIAILTVFPILGFVVLRDLPCDAALAVLAPPALSGLIVVLPRDRPRRGRAARGRLPRRKFLAPTRRLVVVLT